MRTTLKSIVVLALIILAAIFIQENPWLNNANEIHFINYRTIPIPLYLIILGSVLLGIILVSWSMLITQLRLKKKLRLQTKKTKQLEAELYSLRNLPLVEPGIEKKPDTEAIPESA